MRASSWCRLFWFNHSSVDLMKCSLRQSNKAVWCKIDGKTGSDGGEKAKLFGIKGIYMMKQGLMAVDKLKVWQCKRFWTRTKVGWVRKPGQEEGGWGSIQQLARHLFNDSHSQSSPNRSSIQQYRIYFKTSLSIVKTYINTLRKGWCGRNFSQNQFAEKKTHDNLWSKRYTVSTFKLGSTPLYPKLRTNFSEIQSTFLYHRIWLKIGHSVKLGVNC